MDEGELQKVLERLDLPRGLWLVAGLSSRGNLELHRGKPMTDARQLSEDLTAVDSRIEELGLIWADRRTQEAREKLDDAIAVRRNLQERFNRSYWVSANHTTIRRHLTLQLHVEGEDWDDLLLIRISREDEDGDWELVPDDELDEVMDIPYHIGHSGQHPYPLIAWTKKHVWRSWMWEGVYDFYAMPINPDPDYVPDQIGE